MTKSEVERAILELPVEDQLSLVVQVWDRFADEPNELPPLSEEERQLIGERLSAHEADPNSALSLEETLVEARRLQRR